MTFTIRAEGTNLKYQWNGINGASATATGSVSKQNNNTQVTCTVSNGAGSVTSNPARITVYWPPETPNASANPSTVTLGSNTQVTLRAQFSDKGNPSVNENSGTWYFGTNQSIGNGNPYNYTPTSTQQSGNYFYSLTWNGKSISSSAARLTVNPKPNSAPTIELAGPTPGSTIALNRDLLMTVNVNDPDGLSDIDNVRVNVRHTALTAANNVDQTVISSISVSSSSLSGTLSLPKDIDASELEGTYNVDMTIIDKGGKSARVPASFVMQWGH